MPEPLTTVSLMLDRSTETVAGSADGSGYFQDDYFQDDYFQADILYCSANVEKSTQSLLEHRGTIDI